MTEPASLDPHRLQGALDDLMERDEPFQLAFEPRDTSRGIADAAFLVAFLALIERYGEPDYPKRHGNLEPVDDADGSPMAVWDLDSYELALFVREIDGRATVWLAKDD